MDSIYAIIACERLDINAITGFPDLGCVAFCGYYTDLKSTIMAVESNYCDIWETMYNYVIVERYDGGMYGLTEDRYFFKWNNETKGYDQIEAPQMDGFCGFLG